jgi:hypothetical protein
MGLNEAAVDTRPVNAATLTIGGRQTSTNGQGRGMVKVRRGRELLTVRAGDTLEPTSVLLNRR